MNFSFSEYKTYLECPKKYKYQKDRFKPSVPASKYFALYGILIQKFFEYYSNTYSKQNDYTTDKIKENLKGIWKGVLDKNYVDWNDPWVKYSADDLYNQAYADIIDILKKFNFFKYSISEQKIKINLKKTGDVLVSKLDFIYNNPDGTVEIIDGKGTDTLGKNVENDQLYFYALVYLLHYRKIPDKIGFFYYRLKVIDYIPLDMNILMDFKNRFLAVKSTIKKDKEFCAKISLSKTCQWCDFKYDCKEHTTKKEANRSKKKKLIPDNPNGGITLLSL